MLKLEYRELLGHDPGERFHPQLRDVRAGSEGSAAAGEDDAPAALLGRQN